MSIYIRNDLEDRLEALEAKNTILKEYNEYRQIVDEIDHRSQVGFGFVFTVSDSDSQFRIRKSNTKLENIKVILWSFKGN